MDIKRVEKILEGKEPDYEEGVDLSADAVQSNGYFNTGRSFVKESRHNNLPVAVAALLCSVL